MACLGDVAAALRLCSAALRLLLSAPSRSFRITAARDDISLALPAAGCDPASLGTKGKMVADCWLSRGGRSLQPVLNGSTQAVGGDGHGGNPAQAEALPLHVEPA